MHLTRQLALVVVVINLARQTVHLVIINEVQFPMATVHATVLTTIADSLRHILDGIGIVVLCVGVFAHR